MSIRVATGSEQVRAVTEAAGVVERPRRGMIDVRGDDAVEYLQGQVTNDVAALSPGQGCYAALLTPKGRIISDARVLMLGDDELWLDTEPVGLGPALAELRKYKIGRRVELEDRSDEQALLSLVGPHSDRVAKDALALERLPVAEHEWLGAQLESERVIVVRSEIGLDFLLPASAVAALFAALTEAGAAVVDEQATDVARVEHGLPRFGVDIGPDNLPGEAGITNRAVNFTKGCYVGQEPVARMFHKGHPNRLLRGLRLSDPVAPGAGLLLEGKAVGSLTSAANSPLHGPIGLAIVRREAAPGDVLAIDGSTAQATVVELPFERTAAS